VRDSLLAWFSKHGTDLKAYILYKAWLDIGGDTELIRDPLFAWLAEHGTDFKASFVYQAWLNGGSNIELIQDSLMTWLSKYGTKFDALFVYKAWLKTSRNTQLVQDDIIDWLSKHKTNIKAHFLFKAWFDAGGKVMLVHDSILAWLSIHGITSDVGLIYQAWLKAGGDLESVRVPLMAWLDKYGLTDQAGIVCQAWFNAGGMSGLLIVPTMLWFGYDTNAQPDMIYEIWLAAGGDPKQVYRNITQWLDQHGSGDRGDSLIRLWLESGGISSIFSTPLIFRLLQSYRKREAVYSTRHPEHLNRPVLIIPHIRPAGFQDDSGNPLRLIHNEIYSAVNEACAAMETGSSSFVIQKSFFETLPQKYSPMRPFPFRTISF
jgi:hypothetical protein